jgi:DNA repair protein RadC
MKSRRVMMKALPARDRPREKLEREGAGTLGDLELVAVLVGHGTAASDAMALAERVLRLRAGSRPDAHELDELCRVAGVGAVLARRIRRPSAGPPRRSPPHPRVLIRSARDALSAPSFRVASGRAIRHPAARLAPP